MILILKRILTRLRIALFPTGQEKEVLRWLSDGGDEKFRYDYNIGSDSLVIDLGGYKGQWASDIYARFNCRILIFEPVKKFYGQIVTRFKMNQKVEVFCLALGANRREETLSLCEDGSSVFTKSGPQETIQFEDVAHFFKQKDIEQVDLLKINIEGGEYELLPRLFATGLINRIKHLQIQFHDIGPDSKEHLKNICAQLAKTHRPRYQYKFVWEAWDRLDV